MSQPLAQPFSFFCADLRPHDGLRAAISAAYRRAEPECIAALLPQARMPIATATAIRQLSERLVTALRAQSGGSGVQQLIQEFSLSSVEGVALMCLAEALLRIPDIATRDALIRDKIGHGDWASHLKHKSSLFVNAATWGLVVTGKLVAPAADTGLSAALTRLLARSGEPLIRKGVDLAMRMMGEQFVAGESIAGALVHSRKLESQGFRYSYDMLGEAAATNDDALRYFAAYEQAIHAIGAASAGKGIYDGPGISIKLSALHPRYSRAQRDRIMTELWPRLQALAVLARRYDIGLNIDAEEAERLDLSLDLLEALCRDPDLDGWNGIGFVVQAYQKRAPFVIDFVIDLAHRTGHRLMVRLVKGAYWDSEIKRAQVDGLNDYPVYTRKVHTDLAYLACARTLLAQPDAVYPQFATHNAQTVATIYHMAGPDSYTPGQYEFQCLHGMGEPLYRQVVGLATDGRLARPCRIYAPVGTHETLLAYLVRRLLENGANTSFVHLIADHHIEIAELVADPVDIAMRITPIGAPNDRIVLPCALYGDGDGDVEVDVDGDLHGHRIPSRRNSAGLDLSDETLLTTLGGELADAARREWRLTPAGQAAAGDWRAIRNPADRRDVIGQVADVSVQGVQNMMAIAAQAVAGWEQTVVTERAACLDRAADLMQEAMPQLMALLVREAGKSLPNAISEVREAIDFLRYYAMSARTDLSAPICRALGVAVCISPWNFPLAIFTGQVSAALVAGNVVLAKPAEQTPLIAAEAVRLLHRAGVPEAALQWVPGAGDIGAALVADIRTTVVLFTGSTEVARSIGQTLAGRLGADGQPIPLIAETGGQNVMIVDSSSLPEQVVADVLQSSFDSAGQRCSALRVLCLQEDIAERTLTMLHGAAQELRIGHPDRLDTDVGPVIDDVAAAALEVHIAAMFDSGQKITRLTLPSDCENGAFIAPAIIELDKFSRLDREVFGPVLHVVRYRRDMLDRLLADIRASGYGLTMGVHSRIDDTVAQVARQAHVGNLYVNRNMVGAVVGVQPFGGENLSGTGPKAGGPLYLLRLMSRRPPGLPESLLRTMSGTNTTASAASTVLPDAQSTSGVIEALDAWLRAMGADDAVSHLSRYRQQVRCHERVTLAGPTGEDNSYGLTPRGLVLCIAQTESDMCAQLAAAIASGNRALIAGACSSKLIALLPYELTGIITSCPSVESVMRVHYDAVLFEGNAVDALALHQAMRARPGPITPLQIRIDGAGDYQPEWLLCERSVSVNTAAAGGNATLMTAV